MSTPQTFSLDGGKVFVTNLLWLALPPGKASDRKAEIKRLATEQNYDLMVLRTTGRHQIGFAKTSDGFANGMMSAAALISKTVDMQGMGQNVIIALNLGNDRWLFFQQLQDITTSDGDTIGTEDEIQRRMRRELSDGSVTYDTIIAPPEWHIQRSQEMSFEEFLPRVKPGSDTLDYKRWWTLRPVKTTTISRQNVIVVVALIAIAAAAYNQYTQWQQRQIAEKHAAEERIRIAEAAKHHANAAPVSVPEVVHPWKLLPRAVPFTEACDAAIQTAHDFYHSAGIYHPAGFTLRDAACIASSRTLILSWTRGTTGNIAALQKIDPQMGFTADYSIATKSMQIFVRDQPEEPLPAASQRYTELLDASTVRHIPIALKPVTRPPLPAPPNTQPKDIQLANWTEQQWELTTQLSPTDVVSRLSGNGFRVSTITTTIGQDGLLSHTLGGTQYGNP